jgi:hypothetical protein
LMSMMGRAKRITRTTTAASINKYRQVSASIGACGLLPALAWTHFRQNEFSIWNGDHYVYRTIPTKLRDSSSTGWCTNGAHGGRAL